MTKTFGKKLLAGLLVAGTLSAVPVLAAADGRCSCKCGGSDQSTTERSPTGGLNEQEYYSPGR